MNRKTPAAARAAPSAAAPSSATPVPAPEAERGADDPVQAVRRFNRFYTRLLGLLDEHQLASGFSLTEMRVLYELAHRQQPAQRTASVLARELGLDAAYLSRLLRGFAERGLLAREAHVGDARVQQLRLTVAGRAAVRPLERASQQQVQRLLQPLTAAQRGELVAAMRRIEQLLAPPSPVPPVPPVPPSPPSAPAATAPVSAASTAASLAAGAPADIQLRGLQIGDIGWIARRQGQLYAQEYGWDGRFEALVADIAARFVRDFDPRWERAWVAEREGRILGSVFCVKVSRRRGHEEAKLRLLYVEPEARGSGLGGRLTDACIAFAREKRYRRLTLWTNDVLVAARRIYQARGFELQREERHESFGHAMVGQYWALPLV